MKYDNALSLSFSEVRSVVSRHAPSGPRFLHIMTVSPVKRVGASVSLPHSSAWAGEGGNPPTMKKGRRIVVAIVNEREAPRRSARESEATSVRSSTTSNLSLNVVVGFDADIGGVGGGSDVADTIFLCILLLAEENAVTLVAPPPPQMKMARNSKKEMGIMVNGQKSMKSEE